MSNVFISHSSLDKPFVKKLALALLSEGFPVWLDSWQLDYGDSLLDKIYSGIETSSVVLLILSRRSVESGWVNRELNAALMKEQQCGRKFVIPLQIDDCELPLKIADRFYADFSSSFSSSLERLCQVLEKQGCRQFAVSPERELLALRFVREVHLDIASLNKALMHIRQRQSAIALTKDQIVVISDPEYEQLLNRLHERVDNIETDPFFSPAFEQALRETLTFVQEKERHLREGVALLATNYDDTTAIYWFARIVRTDLVYNL